MSYLYYLSLQIWAICWFFRCIQICLRRIPYNPGPDKSTNDHILSEILRMIIYRALNLTGNVGTVLWVRLCSDCVTPLGSCTAFINYSGKTTVTKKSNFLEYKT